MSLELLYVRRAIFKLIGPFHHADRFDDGEFYICNYCQSALESAFNILGIDDNYIKLIDFCKMWEDNERAIWEINHPDEPFGGIMTVDHYQTFKDDYEMWERKVNGIVEEE